VAKKTIIGMEGGNIAGPVKRKLQVKNLGLGRRKLPFDSY
jgi:hypothetical protein